MERQHSGEIRHHILHPKGAWLGHVATSSLRQTAGLIVPTTRDIEDLNHKTNPVVPVPSPAVAFYSQQAFEPVRGDYMRTVDNLMFAIETATRKPVAQIEKDLALLTIQGIDLQRPFIEMGLIATNEHAN